MSEAADGGGLPTPPPSRRHLHLVKVEWQKMLPREPWITEGEATEVYLAIVPQYQEWLKLPCGTQIKVGYSEIIANPGVTDPVARVVGIAPGDPITEYVHEAVREVDAAEAAGVEPPLPEVVDLGPQKFDRHRPGHCGVCDGCAQSILEKQVVKVRMQILMEAAPGEIPREDLKTVCACPHCRCECRSCSAAKAAGLDF